MVQQLVGAVWHCRGERNGQTGRRGGRWKFSLGDGMVLPALVSGEATWLLNTAGIFSPAVRNAVFFCSAQIKVLIHKRNTKHNLHEIH